MPSAAVAFSDEDAAPRSAAAQRRKPPEASGRNQLAVVLDGLHKADQASGARLLHKQFGKGRGLKEVASSQVPPFSSMASAIDVPCHRDRVKALRLVGMPALARFRRNVVVG